VSDFDDDFDGRSMTRWSLLALPLLAGCGVSTLEEGKATPTKNECSADSECGSGTCQGGMCRASQGTFSSVLFEVTPPASVAKIGGVQHLKRIDGLSLNGGAHDIALARLAHMAGVITPNWMNQPALCPFNSDSISVIVTPSDQLLGLGPKKTYTADATYNVNGSFEFSLNVPAGDYDIYLQPKNRPAACALAPQLYRRNTVPEGIMNAAVPLTLPAPATLDLQIAWRAGDNTIEGWRVDMIEPDTRRPVSNEVELTSDSPDTRDDAGYKAKLFYSQVIPAASDPGRELIRLRPREGVAAPTILLQRSGLEVQVQGEAKIDQLTSLPQIVRCEGQVALMGSPEYVPRAVVTISALALDRAAGIMPGISTEYSVTVPADDSGRFSVELFPGKYKVVAVPPTGSGYATAVDEWQVRDSVDLQSGLTVEVTRLVSLNGSVVTTGRAPVAGATVSAVASPASLVVDPLIDPLPVVPRAGSTQVDQNGSFQFGADEGTYDLSVRPAPGTGFAWFVRPGVAVTGDDPVVDLGALELPLPLEYSGVVTAEVAGMTQPVPGALIRAYVYVTGQQAYTIDAMQAASVLQIAETRAGDTGRFKLFIPAQFDRPTPSP
jgi:hypothetical protein